MSAGGSVHIDAGVAIVPNVIKAVEVARRRGILIVWVLFFVSINITCTVGVLVTLFSCQCGNQ